MSEPYVPPIKRFPDGDYCRCWLDPNTGKVMGQLYRKNGRPVGRPYTYEGPNPASWDKR